MYNIVPMEITAICNAVSPSVVFSQNQLPTTGGVDLHRHYLQRGTAMYPTLAQMQRREIHLKC